MTDDRPIFVVDQANTGASARTVLADLTVISFLLCFCESDLMADDKPIVVADEANTSASATTNLAALTAICFLFVSVCHISWPTISRLM